MLKEENNLGMVITLLKEKNSYLETFLEVSERERKSFKARNFDNLEALYAIREDILENIRSLDRRIEKYSRDLQPESLQAEERATFIREPGDAGFGVPLPGADLRNTLCKTQPLLVHREAPIGPRHLERGPHDVGDPFHQLPVGFAPVARCGAHDGQQRDALAGVDLLAQPARTAPFGRGAGRDLADDQVDGALGR